MSVPHTIRTWLTERLQLRPFIIILMVIASRSTPTSAFRVA